MTTVRHQSRDEAFYRRADVCSVEAWLAFLGHRWNALILYHLSLGPKRFKEIAAALPTAAPKVMSERLALLVRRGLVVRPERGAAYELTPWGEQLMPLLHGLEVWARSAPEPAGCSASGEAGSARL